MFEKVLRIVIFMLILIRKSLYSILSKVTTNYAYSLVVYGQKPALEASL